MRSFLLHHLANRYCLLDLAYCGMGRSVTVEVAGESFDGSVKTGAVFDDTARRMRPHKA